MRAKEFVIEGTTGAMPDDANKASLGGYKFRDDGVDRTYNLNQIMKAAAMSDGSSTKAMKMDSESFAGKNNMAYPYTEVEHNMMKQAFNTVGDTKAHDLVRDHKSREVDDTHKVSPVAAAATMFDRKKPKSTQKK